MKRPVEALQKRRAISGGILLAFQADGGVTVSYIGSSDVEVAELALRLQRFAAALVENPSFTGRVATAGIARSS